MAAALAKLCDIHELICIARKINRPSKARTLLGTPGTLSSRCQPTPTPKSTRPPDSTSRVAAALAGVALPDPTIE